MSSRETRFAGVALALIFLAGLLLPPTIVAQEIPLAARALAEGQTLDDRRLQPLKDLNGYFPFAPPETRANWERRSAELKSNLQVALGLHPWPTKTPLNAVEHGMIEFPEYTVSRVYLESAPGFYVTGSLYRPRNQAGPFPGVLCPHGHWSNGRFYDAGEGTAKEQLAKGAEVHEPAARSPLQARCVHLARMGCVVFHYDMLGYADSQQIPAGIAHGFAQQRPEMATDERWGLFSPQAESHLQSVMGLQTWNSIRALDFLESLPEVDRQRLAVTGASGGGTQTFILTALDPRPAVAFPAVMVSTAMQGGCTCENCSLLRVGTGNVELAALFAPKPQALSAADDWTREMSTKGFPELQELYQLVDAADQVALISRTEFGHNYNHVCRTFMYEWFNRFLGLDAATDERPFERLTRDQMTVWNEQHPQPEGGAEFERELLAAWHEDAQSQLATPFADSSRSVSEGLALLREGLDGILRRRVSDGKSLKWEQTVKIDVGSYLRIAGLLTDKQHGEQLPLLFLFPKDWKGAAVLWLSERGKAGLLAADGQPQPQVQRLLDEGICVAGVDLLFQGEFPQDQLPEGKTRRVNNPREAAGYTFGYNHSLLARRVHDVLTTLTFLRTYEMQPQQVALLALDAEVAPIAIAARAQAGSAIDLAALDSHGFRFGTVDDLQDRRFLPGGAKYGDIPGMLAAAEPHPLLLAGEAADELNWLQSVYRSAGKLPLLTRVSPDDALAAAAAVDWLLQQLGNNQP